MLVPVLFLVVTFACIGLAVWNVRVHAHLKRVTSERENAKNDARHFKNMLCDLAFTCTNVINAERGQDLVMGADAFRYLDPDQRDRLPPKEMVKTEWYLRMTRTLCDQLPAVVGTAKQRARVQGMNDVLDSLAPWSRARADFIYALAVALDGHPDFMFVPDDLQALDPVVADSRPPEAAPSLEWYLRTLGWMQSHIKAIIARSGMRAAQQ